MSITAAKVRAPLMRLCAALTAPAFAPQRMEVRQPVVAGDHRLTVDQE